MNPTPAPLPANHRTPLTLPRPGAFGLGIMLAMLLIAGMAHANEPDSDYVAIYSTINGADNLKNHGAADQAHAKYLEAQQQLLAFQKANPNWEPPIVAFRLKYLAEQIVETDTAVASDNGGGNISKSDKTSTTAKSPVKLLDAGSEPRVALRLHPGVGDKQALTMTMKMNMNMSTAGTAMPAVNIPAVVITMDVEVKSIAANGEIAYTLTYDDASVATGTDTLPAVADAMKSSLAGLRGLTGNGRMSDRGLNLGMQMKLPAGADPQISQMMEQMKESFSSSSSPFPDEAVGPGAKWEYQTKLKSQGMTMNQRLASELVSNEGDRLTLRNTLAQNAANQKIQNPAMPGLKMDLIKMTGNGSGNSTFDLSRLLPVTATLEANTETAMAIDMGQQKQSMDMKMNMSVTIESK